MDTQGKFSDREMMEDVLVSQNLVTERYNLSANECSSPAVMGELMNILNEEHQMQHEVLDEMQKRGWYHAEPAPGDQITRCRDQFTRRQ